MVIFLAFLLYISKVRNEARNASALPFVMSFPFNVHHPEWVKSHISNTHAHIISHAVQRESNLSVPVLYCHSYLLLAYCHNLHCTPQTDRHGGICEEKSAITTTTHLTPKQEMRVICGCWLLAQSTLGWLDSGSGGARPFRLTWNMEVISVAFCWRIPTA